MRLDVIESRNAILYPYRGMDVKFQAIPERLEFRGVSR